MAEFDAMRFVKRLCTYSPRLAHNEQKAARFIEKFLRKQSIPFKIQKFKTAVPICTKAFLIVDGRRIKCKGSTFVSGKILGNKHIVDSWKDRNEYPDYNINYTSYASDVISVVDFYNYPAIAVRKSDVKRLVRARNVYGEVRVKKTRYVSRNILVGNLRNPKFLAFAHYDCVGNGGAVDNASGVGAMMDVIVNHRELLDSTLFVFSGCEELSYAKKCYGGFGFRVFEKKYPGLIERCAKIIVFDGVGIGKPHITQDKEILWLTFPVKSHKKISRKVYLIECADARVIRRIYHSDSDTPEKLKKRHLVAASDMMLSHVTV